MASADDLIGSFYSLQPTEDDPEQLVNRVVAVTGCDESTARFYLEAANQNAELAVTSILESPQHQDKHAEKKQLPARWGGGAFQSGGGGGQLTRAPTRRVDPDDLIGSMFSMQATEEDPETVLQRVVSITGAAENLAREQLEIASWNIEVASAAILDIQNKKRPNFDASVEEMLIESTPDDESVPSGSTFAKGWRVQNTGTFAWPPGCSLGFVTGEKFGGVVGTIEESVEPGGTADVILDGLVAPHGPGSWKGFYQLFLPSGEGFGDVITVTVFVLRSEGGFGQTAFAGLPTSTLMEGDGDAFEVRHDNSPYRSPVVSPHRHRRMSRSRSRSPNSSSDRRSRSRSRENSDSDDMEARPKRMKMSPKRPLVASPKKDGFLGGMPS